VIVIVCRARDTNTNNENGRALHPGLFERLENSFWRENEMRSLLGLLVISGAVTATLFFLTSLDRTVGTQATQAITLKPGSVIQDGSFVAIEFTLTDDNGKVIESNVGKEPLTYLHGSGQIVPGLERELAGLKVGDQKKIVVKPEDGYRSDPNAFQEIPKDKLPPEAQKVGTVLATKGPQGETIAMRVHEVKDKTIVVDFNHPLAGKTLNFDVKVTDIRSGAVE
jgi:FKBP-type peptidyl-prolyl cis-trans isomerase SlyD